MREHALLNIPQCVGVAYIADPRGRWYKGSPILGFKPYTAMRVCEAAPCTMPTILSRVVPIPIVPRAEYLFKGVTQ